MKKHVKSLGECMDRLQVATDALVSEGAASDTVVHALVAVARKAAQKHRQPAALFDEAAKALMNAAEHAFEQAKKDRADKRAKRLGLTED